MKFELTEAFASTATQGLEWGQFTCPPCQYGRFLSQGSYRKVYTVDQRSCDQFRRHLLVEHDIHDHDERVKIVEFLRRSAIDTSTNRRTAPKDAFTNQFPFYSCCVLCDKQNRENVIFPTCHSAIDHLAIFHCVDDAKSIMHIFNAGRGYWSSVKMLIPRMQLQEMTLEKMAEETTTHVYNCPFCLPKNRKYQSGSLELHLFGHHWVRSIRFLDALFQAKKDRSLPGAIISVPSSTITYTGSKITLEEDHILQGTSSNKKRSPASELIAANFDECPDSAAYWHLLPELPATMRLMPSHRQLCHNYMQSINAVVNTLAFLCPACCRQKQPELEQTNQIAGLMKHLEIYHRVESGFHLLLFTMQRRPKVRDLQIAYFILGHHVLDFQAFLNPHGSRNFGDKFRKAVPNRTSYCPFCCIYGATSMLPTPKESPQDLATHFKAEHAFKNKTFARELADLLFGKTVHVDVPAELLT